VFGNLKVGNRQGRVGIVEGFFKLEIILALGGVEYGLFIIVSPKQSMVVEIPY
jgi:hypothetical protein